MGEKSEMSSVQSAWEDLVVENPNRAKLEACLLTTIMLVVLCIFALLTYVYIQLQPANNVHNRPAFWRTNFHDKPADRQFAYRLMGWVNWSSTRCRGFSEWACGGRLIEASSLAVYETAEMAGEAYAKEYLVELIDRGDAAHVLPPTGDIAAVADDNYTIPDNNVPRLSQFLKMCRQGYPTAEAFVADFSPLFDVFKFVENSQSNMVWEKYKEMQKVYNYYPLGRMYVTNPEDKDGFVTGKPNFITVEPPRLIARPNDKSNKKYIAMMKAGFASINKFVKGCCADNGEGVAKHELLILDAMAQAEPDDVDKGNIFPKVKNKPDICEKMNSIDPSLQCRFRNRRVPEALYTLETRGADAINWAVLKFFILLSPLMPPDEPDLQDFFKLVAWYHRRAEMPHRDLLCMDIAEMFFPFAIQAVLKATPYLNETKTQMLEALKKLDAQLSKAGDASGAEKVTLFSSQLLKGAFAGTKNLGDLEALWTEGYGRIVFFHPDEPPKNQQNFPNPVPDPQAPSGTAVTPMAYLKASIPSVQAEQTARWVGPLFTGDAMYDVRKDRIFAPLGLAGPPFYHPDPPGEKVMKHSAPAYLVKLCKALVERFVQAHYGFGKAVNERNPEGYKDLAKKEKAAVNTYVQKEVKCFKKEVSPFLMWDLFYTKSATVLAYQIWRRGFNHATINADTQLRLHSLRFLSEEVIFFVTAANGMCQVANPNFASTKDVEMAPKIVNTIMHGPLLGDAMLCFRTRPVYKAECGGMFPPLSLGDEAQFTVEAWRKRRGVVWDR